MKINEEITRDTRFDSFITHPATKRCEEIRNALKGKALTARELTYALGYTERNAVAPRLTEMMKRGEVVTMGKRKDGVTRKMVAVYRLI